MKMLVLKTLICLSGLSFMAACALMPDMSGVLPDKKNEYRKSESLPDLEIPPDLTAGAISDSMNIPGEDGASLSEYAGASQPETATRAAQTGTEDEQRLSLTGTKEEIWPGLREFFTSRGYPVEVDDVELGVLETGWSTPARRAGLTGRDKYRIFYEQGENEQAAILYVSQQRQTKLESGDEWMDQDKDPETETQLAAALGEFFKSAEQAGEATQSATAPAADELTAQPGADETDATDAANPLLRLLSAGEDKQYLSVPEGFEQAWQNTELALQDSEWQILEKDEENMLFRLSYQRAEDEETGEAEEKKTLLSNLAFWRNKPEQLIWQLRFTPAGNDTRTELAVLDENDEWQTTPESSRLLELIRERYPLSPPG